MAAAAGPKSIGLRLEPRFPLGLQRVHDPGLMAPGRESRESRAAAALPPAFGIYTRLTGIALNGSAGSLHPVGQLCLGLRGQHHLAIHARRQTTSVALGHPPHAQQRVRARPEHQLLQPANPCKVPRLRCREDPLPQPPYFPSTRRQSIWRQSRIASSGPLTTTWSRRLACPRVPGSSIIFLFTGSPDRVSPLSRPGTRPGIRPVIRDDQLEELAIRRGFLLPFGHRHSLLGHPIPAEEFGSPHGRPTGPTRPDLDGVTAFRTHEQRPGWAPPIPRGRRCSSRPDACPAGARRFTAASPCTPLHIPSRGLA